MAKITREKLKQINEGCQNDFTLDLHYFLIWGEKTLRKIIELKDGYYIEAKIDYYKHYEKFTNEYNVTYNKDTGLKVPTLLITLWKTTEGENFATSQGLRQEYNISEPVKRKNLKVLQQLTSKYTTEEILKLYNEKKCKDSTLIG